MLGVYLPQKGKGPETNSQGSLQKKIRTHRKILRAIKKGVRDPNKRVRAPTKSSLHRDHQKTRDQQKTNFL